MTNLFENKMPSNLIELEGINSSPLKVKRWSPKSPSPASPHYLL